MANKYLFKYEMSSSHREKLNQEFKEELKSLEALFKETTDDAISEQKDILEKLGLDGKISTASIDYANLQSNFRSINEEIKILFDGTEGNDGLIERREKESSRKVKELLFGDSGSDKFTEHEIKELLITAAGTCQDNPTRLFVRELLKQKYVSVYPFDILDKPGEITLIPVSIILMILIGIFFWATHIAQNVELLTEAYADESVTTFQALIGLTFQAVALFSFIAAMFILPIHKYRQFKANEVNKKSEEFKLDFLGTVPTQVMNLGIITMIFAIVGIIFFKQEQLLDVSYYVKTTALIPVMGWFTDWSLVGREVSEFGFDVLKLLLLAGGLTEVAAFYLGYRFPERKEKKTEKAIEEGTPPPPPPPPGGGLSKKEMADAVAEGVVKALKQIKL